MDLSTLASIGEFVGGFAVLTSLIYLIVNVRQNSRHLTENTAQLKRVEMRHTYEQHDRYRLATMDREIAELLMKGLADERLDLPDRVRFNNLMTMIIYSIQNNWDAVHHEVMEEEEWERSSPSLSGVFSTSGGRRWWRRTRGVFMSGFVQDVENMFEEELSKDSAVGIDSP